MPQTKKTRVVRTDPCDVIQRNVSLSLSQVFAIAGGLAPSQVRQIIHEYEDMHQLVSFSLPLLEARPR